MRRRALLLAVCVLALPGCGVGAGERVTEVSLTVTDDFGGREIGVRRAASPPGGETVMRFLQRSFDVNTRHGGGFVTSIEGLASEAGGGRQVDWFYYVNGIEAQEGAAATKLHPGDRVWWDRHEWSAAMRIPAVVGSFPEPFLTGSGGRRIPVRLDCAPDAPCDEVQRRLEAAGVKRTSRAAIRQPSGERILRLVVGTWRQVRLDPVAQRLEDGPRITGIYARFAQDGRRIELLDRRGRVARRLGAGAGLVAATRFEEQQPTWLVTGTDAAGVREAAAALEEGALDQHFGLAISEGLGIPVPVVERRG